MAKTYKISEVCGDWALHIPPYGKMDEEMILIFNSRSNAELVKSVLEWEDAHPNAAVPYKSTLTPPNEWISVEDRLPGVTGKYIACVKDNMGARWTICADWSVEMKSWFGEFGEIKNKVTHWMPLPKPPESRPTEGEGST